MEVFYLSVYKCQVFTVFCNWLVVLIIYLFIFVITIESGTLSGVSPEIEGGFVEGTSTLLRICQWKLQMSLRRKRLR